MAHRVYDGSDAMTALLDGIRALAQTFGVCASGDVLRRPAGLSGGEERVHACAVCPSRKDSINSP